MGRIVSVKRMAVHDGPGLRTTLFLKGCPLKCRWCHNPECISPKPQAAYIEKKCLVCGECTGVCPASRLEESRHVFDRELCTACGKCADFCLGEALVFYGREVSPEDALALLLEDRAFYEQSGGGATLSGGEPLMQPEFTSALLRLLKENCVHTALDTCGFASRAAVDAVLPYTDLFLYDVKAADEQVHIRLTGRSNRPVIDNLRYIVSRGKRIEIRIPLIPGLNDQEIPAIGQILGGIGGIERVRVLPYHPFAASKYHSLGETYDMPDIRRPGPEQMASAVAALKACGLNTIDGGHE